MALQNNKILSSGVVGNYWKIVEMTINVADQTSQVVMFLFIDQAARAANKDPIYKKAIPLSGASFPFTTAAMNANSPVVIAYSAIKADPDLIGSLDV